MMVRPLYKIFREESFQKFEEVFQERLNSEQTVKLPFHIKPINQPDTFNLYYIPTQKMIQLVTKVYKYDNQIDHLSNKLPRIAKENLIFELLVDELQHTNDLEGVRSTKEEIIRSARDVESNKHSARRFVSMIESYRKLLSGEEISINSASDIRWIYDEITKGEIAKDEIPDGKLFRSDTTFVHKKSGTGKIIHQGVTPESKVIQLMDEFINFMNTADVPFLIKIAIGHFYFGYIHPFYDGNGRTSRFISSLYLNKEFNELASISLSRGCNTHRNNYLKAFELTSSFANSGVMNYFIETFLTIISETQKEIILQVKEKIYLLDHFIKKINKDHRLDKKTREIMFILGQNHFFAVDDRGFTVQELSKITSKSEQTIRSTLEEMKDSSFVDTKGKRPVIYLVKDSYFG